MSRRSGWRCWAARVVGLGLGLGLGLAALAGSGCGSSQRTLFASSEKYPTLEESPGEFFKTSTRPHRFERIGSNRFYATVGSMDGCLEAQTRDDTCWAACATALLRQAGVKCEQGDLVRAFGEGGADEMKLVLAVAADQGESRRVVAAIRQVNQSNGRLPAVVLASHTATSDDLIESLTTGHPVVIGINSPEGGAKHLRVVYGAEFAQVDPASESQFVLGQSEGWNANKVLAGESTAAGAKSGVYVRFAVVKLYCFDPLPSRGKMEMSGGEAQASVAFIVNRPMADRILADTHAQWQEACRNPQSYQGTGATINTIGDWFRKR